MLVTALPEALRFLDRYYLAVYGVAVVLLVVFLPQGLWGWLESVVRRRSRARDAGPGPVPPETQPSAVTGTGSERR
jgi:branched-chain amino acid transport system permease protein